MARIKSMARNPASRMLLWALLFIPGCSHAAIPIRGVNSHSVRQEESDLARTNDTVTAGTLCANAIRVDIFWEAFEQLHLPWLYNQPLPLCDGNDHMNFLRLDQFVDLCSSKGIKPLLMIYGTPAWASSAPSGAPDYYRYPPANPADLASFCEKIGARYYARLAGIEIWNEPNLSYFFHQYSDAEGGITNTAAQLANMYKAVYQQIKGGLFPNTRVVAGGLSSAPRSFMKQLYLAGSKGYYDAFSVHPYSSTPEGTRNLVQRFREYMLTNSDPAELWLSEYGWSTATNAGGLDPLAYADYHERALWLLDSLVVLSNKAVNAVFPFQLRDTPTDGSYFGYAGVVDTAWVPKTAFWRLQLFYRTWFLGRPTLFIDRGPPAPTITCLTSGSEKFTLESSEDRNAWTPESGYTTNANGRLTLVCTNAAPVKFFRLRQN